MCRRYVRYKIQVKWPKHGIRVSEVVCKCMWQWNTLWVYLLLLLLILPPFILVLLSMYVFVFGSFVVLLHAGTAAATAVTMSTRSLFFSFFTIADRLKRYGAYEVVSFFFCLTSHLKQFRSWFHLIKQRLCASFFQTCVCVCVCPCISLPLALSERQSVSQSVCHRFLYSLLATFSQLHLCSLMFLSCSNQPVPMYPSANKNHCLIFPKTHQTLGNWCVCEFPRIIHFFIAQCNLEIVWANVKNIFTVLTIPAMTEWLHDTHTHSHSATT